MGYNISIGKPVIEDCINDVEGYDDAITAYYRVERESHPDAPNFDRFTEYGNERSPGYTVWANFADEAGLKELFFDKHSGLMREHPGCFLIRPDHLETVRAAISRRKATNGGKEPGFDDSQYIDGRYIVTPTGKDGVLARLLWLEFWMDHAIRTYPIPAIFNN